jgi:Asp-tRNA(Asn)/Glu-tRNA(Gln) amidotransferase A subunit family amidase
MDGGYGYKNIGDRAGIHCRTVADAVKVLDAAKGFDTRDIYSAVPMNTIPKEPYTTFLVSDAQVASKPLRGMRIAMAREFMVKHTKNDAAISDQADKEIKAVLRDKLGAELIETVDAKYADDPTVPNVKYTFADALAEVLPSTVPEYFWQKTADGKLEFAVPGWDVTSPEYLVALERYKAPLSPALNLRRIFKSASQSEGPLGWNKYLADRGDTRVKDWKAWAANAKFDSDAARAGAVNSANVKDARVKPDDISYLKMHTVLQLVILKVMHENGIDAFVNPENTLPHFKLGQASEPVADGRDSNGFGQAFTAMAGTPEITVPAGFNQIVYEPAFALSADKKKYDLVTGAVESKLPHPMPISLTFWAGPGDEPVLIKHRTPPPMFGPVEAQYRTTSR